MVFSYLIHGLVLQTLVPCDGLGEALASAAPDLRAFAGVVPRQLGAAMFREGPVELTPSASLFRGGRRSARFLVEGGNTITFEKNAGFEEALFLHHLLYPVMAAALWQRGLFVLHASSVLSPDGAILIAGESGAGKSTTVARLLREGWPLLTDDVTALRPDAAGVLQVMPGARHVHLNEVSAAQAGLDTTGLVQHDWHRKKMAIPVPPAAERHPSKISRIVALSHAEAFLVQSVRGRDKLPLLLRTVYGPVLPQQIAAHHDLMARALSDIDMIAIGRPSEQWTLDEIVKAIRDG